MTIELKNVCLKRNGTWILQYINWKVEKGEHWVLFGLNGAGKSTLLTMLNGNYFPTEGTVKVLGKEFGKVDIREHIRRKIGLVSSSLRDKLYQTDSAYEIVLSGAFTSIGLYETPNDEIRQKAVFLMEEMGSLEYADRDYATLSQGEKQRVLIARSLMNDPEILILDEPVNGLDFVAREQVLEMIEKIANEPDGPTVLYVTHHLEEILPPFQKTLLLKEGKVFDAGKTKDLITSETLSRFFEIPVEVFWRNGRPLLSRKATANH